MNNELVKLTTYFGERDRARNGLLGMQLPDIHARHRVKVSVLMRGIEGFGRLHNLHTALQFESSLDLPLISVVVDKRERIQSLLPVLPRIKNTGLQTLATVRLSRNALADLPLPLSHEGGAKLTIYLTLNQRAQGVPAFVAACDLLYRRGADCATVLLGVDGSLEGHRMRPGFFSRNADVPVIVVAVGPSAHLAKASSQVGALLPGIPLTLEHIQLCKLEGDLIATPHPLPVHDRSGRPLLQQLTVYSLGSSHRRRRLNHEVVRRLRATNASGATSLRGIWGFHGHQLPEASKYRQLHRNVPIVTTVIDTSDAIQRLFPIIDELTAEHGLVTSGQVSVPTSTAAAESR